MRYITTLALLLALATTSYADTRILPNNQWDDEVALWLARAMVSEADWSTPDHIAIAYVLKNRWERTVQNNPDWTFLDQVRGYCSGLRGDARSERSRWVRALTADGAQPDGWPAEVAWSSYQPHWAKALRLAHAWVRGAVRNPCEGHANQWGGPMDRPGSGWKAVDCGRTVNIFYRQR